MRLWEVISKKRFCLCQPLRLTGRTKLWPEASWQCLGTWIQQIVPKPAGQSTCLHECSVTTMWSLLPISQSRRAEPTERGVDLVNHRHENRPHVPVSTSTNHSFVLFSVFICIHTYTYAGFGCNLLRYIPRLRKQEINAPLFTISFPGDFPGRHAAECAFTVERC